MCLNVSFAGYKFIWLTTVSFTTWDCSFSVFHHRWLECSLLKWHCGRLLWHHFKQKRSFSDYRPSPLNKFVFFFFLYFFLISFLSERRWHILCDQSYLSASAPWPLGLKKKTKNKPILGSWTSDWCFMFKLGECSATMSWHFFLPFSLLELICSWWGWSAPQTLFFPLCFSDRITVYLPANSLSLSTGKLTKAAPGPLQSLFLFAVKFFNSRLFHVVFQKILFLYWCFYSWSHFHNIFLKFFKHSFL